MFLTFREKMEIRYLVYFLFNQKSFRPSLPPKLLAITVGAAIIFFLLARAEELNSFSSGIGVIIFSVASWFLIVVGNISPRMNISMQKAEDSLKQRYLFWKEGNSSGEIKEWITSLEIEAKQGKFSFER